MKPYNIKFDWSPMRQEPVVIDPSAFDGMRKSAGAMFDRYLKTRQNEQMEERLTLAKNLDNRQEGEYLKKMMKPILEKEALASVDKPQGLTDQVDDAYSSGYGSSEGLEQYYLQNNGEVDGQATGPLADALAGGRSIVRPGQEDNFNTALSNLNTRTQGEFAKDPTSFNRMRTDEIDPYAQQIKQAYLDKGLGAEAADKAYAQAIAENTPTVSAAAQKSVEEANKVQSDIYKERMKALTTSSKSSATYGNGKSKTGANGTKYYNVPSVDATGKVKWNEGALKNIKSKLNSTWFNSDTRIGTGEIDNLAGTAATTSVPLGGGIEVYPTQDQIAAAMNKALVTGTVTADHINKPLFIQTLSDVVKSSVRTGTGKDGTVQFTGIKDPETYQANVKTLTDAYQANVQANNASLKGGETTTQAMKRIFKDSKEEKKVTTPTTTTTKTTSPADKKTTPPTVTEEETETTDTVPEDNLVMQDKQNPKVEKVTPPTDEKPAPRTGYGSGDIANTDAERTQKLMNTAEKITARKASKQGKEFVADKKGKVEALKTEVKAHFKAWKSNVGDPGVYKRRWEKAKRDLKVAENSTDPVINKLEAGKKKAQERQRLQHTMNPTGSTGFGVDWAKTKSDIKAVARGTVNAAKWVKDTLSPGGNTSPEAIKLAEESQRLIDSNKPKAEIEQEMLDMVESYERNNRKQEKLIRAGNNQSTITAKGSEDFKFDTGGTKGIKQWIGPNISTVNDTPRKGQIDLANLNSNALNGLHSLATKHNVRFNVNSTWGGDHKDAEHGEGRGADINRWNGQHVKKATAYNDLGRSIKATALKMMAEDPTLTRVLTPVGSLYRGKKWSNEVKAGHHNHVHLDYSN